MEARSGGVWGFGGLGAGLSHLGKTKCSWKYAPFKGSIIGSLNEAFPFKEVVLVDRPRGDALGGFVDELPVFF